MKNKKKVPLTKDELYSGVVSANECTGLTAEIPRNEAEADSYRQLVDVPVTSEKTLRKKSRRDN